jgi:hypothetical protein
MGRREDEMPPKGQRNRAWSGTTEPLPHWKPKPKSTAPKKSKSQNRAEKKQRRLDREAASSGVPARKVTYDARLDDAAKRCGYASYTAYVESPAWTDLRCRVIEAYGAERCLACGYPVVCLHHLTYDRLGCELLSDVVLLCARCHHGVHRRCKEYRIPLANICAAIGAIFRWSVEETEQRLVRYLELRLEDEH